MGFRTYSIFLPWTKVVSALKGLRSQDKSYNKENLSSAHLSTQSLINNRIHKHSQREMINKVDIRALIILITLLVERICYIGPNETSKVIMILGLYDKNGISCPIQ